MVRVHVDAHLHHRGGRTVPGREEFLLRLGCERLARSLSRRNLVQGGAAGVQRGGWLHAAAELPELESEINWSPRFEDHRWFRGIQLSADGDINTDLRNHVIDRNISVTPMELEFHTGDSIEFQVFKQTENLD